ncbi:MAG: extracellular solute-binding protein [Patescibacteria group bacterium]|nr:extracellular solute-binding protein [Patescibacteria group bacterium]
MKITLFQGILFGVFGLAAVIGLIVFSTHTNNSNKNNAIGSVVIWGTLPKADMQTVLAGVTQTNQALKGVSYVEKDPATLAADLSTAIATGNSPDLILASQEALVSLTKFITPIPSSALPANIFVNTFIKEGSVFAAPSGGYYGIPYLVDPLVLFSNRTILSSDGIAKPPSTWEALAGLVPSVAMFTPTRQIQRGLIALGTYDNVHDARGILSTLFLQAGVPMSYYGPGGLTANLGSVSSSGAPPGQAVLGFYTQFADPSKVSYTWNVSLPDSQETFLAGGLALYLGYVSEARFFTQANPNLDFNITPAPQPATATSKNVYGLLYAFMIPRGAKNAAGASQTASLLASSAGQAAAATGLAPATLNQLTQLPTDPAGATAYAEALYTSGWLSPAPSDTDSIFSAMIGNVISGRSPINTALVTAEQSLNASSRQ